MSDADSEDDYDWEEVHVPDERHFDVTIHAPTKASEAKKKAGITHAERLIRIDCHKLHTVCLLSNARIRNNWLNDDLLHARLLSVTPLNLQNAFSIPKSRYPDPNQRGRMFEAATTRLAEWWSDYFEITQEGHIVNRTFDQVQTGMAKLGMKDVKLEDEVDVEILQDALDDDGETIRTIKSLMKHALMHSGSRDVSAQLFTSLCRALGIPARLVVSLQSVPWQASVGKPKPTYQKKANTSAKGKGKSKKPAANDDADEKDDMEPVDIPDNVSSSSKISDYSFTGAGGRLDGGSVAPKSAKAKGKGKAKPVVNLRKPKPKGNVLGSTPTASTSKRPVPADPTTTPPVFWTEVFSRADTRWIPVDPIRGIVNRRKVFDPTPISNVFVAQPSIYPPSHPLAPGPKRVITPKSNVRVDNRMLYVVAFEEDGYARDVTRRYAREYGAKVAKAQGGSATIGGGGGKSRTEWWERVLQTVKRPYRLLRDDLEDEELEENQMMEGMPTTVGGFKDHPLYALTRHLKQNQVIHPAPPATRQLGKFRGEPVYPRSSVVSLKTPENWMRSEGRMIREGCQAMKWIKVRTGTVGKMREVEVLRERMEGAGTSGPQQQHADDNVRNSGANELMQGLYAREQTEMYIPDPVVDGKVPKNNFGNIDLYVPSMLPAGGVHVPFKGVVKIARKLKLDHAEAVTGFEFKKRRAFPVVEGVVIAAENADILLEAYWEAEKEKEETARTKREERVLQQWTRLIHGLRIRQRLQAQYASKPAREAPAEAVDTDGDHELHHGIGGFLVSADDVVQPYSLPKETHVPPPNTSDTIHTNGNTAVVHDELITYHTETMDLDSDTEDVNTGLDPASNGSALIPKSLDELAQQAADREVDVSQLPVESASELIDIQPKPTVAASVDSSKIILPARSKRKDPPTAAAVPTRVSTLHASTKKRRRQAGQSRAEGDETEEETETPKPKRSKTAAIAPPTTTRTLRPRTSKSAAAIREEKEREDAFRRAVA